jgi:uncharacterized delta-60 repeat protein
MKVCAHRAAGLGVGLALLASPGELSAASGALDPTFRFGEPEAPATFAGLIVQSDDSILLAGAPAPGGPYRLFRLLPDGRVDVDYPRTLRLASPGMPDQPVGMALLPDGRLMADATGVPGEAADLPVRVLSDGTLDASFTPGVRRQDGTVLPGGATVLAAMGSGETLVQAGGGLRRLTASGAMDLNWAKANGEPVVTGYFTAAAAQSSRRVIACGQPGTGVSRNVSADRLMRFEADGTRDPQFPAWRPLAVSGRYGNGDAATIRRMVVLPDDRIVLIGTFSWLTDGSQTVARGSVARLNADGTMDAGFNSEIGFTDFYKYAETPQWNATNSRSVHALAVGPDGRLVLGGNFSSYDGIARTNLARLNSDGSLDTTFEPPAPTRWVTQVGVQSDGRVLFSCGQLSDIGGLAAYDGSGGLVRLQGGPSFSAAPVITRQPESQALTLQPGETKRVLFAVVAANASREPLTFQWRRNGGLVVDNAMFQGAAGPVLVLAHAAQAEAGRYECVVASVGGRVVSEPAFLSVNGSTSPASDRGKPQLAVSAPAALETRTLNGTVTFHGSAWDQIGLAWVLVEHNGGGLHPVHGLENWQSTHLLSLGTNRFRFQAVDLAGNRSSFLNRTVIRVEHGAFTLQITGEGNVQRPSLANSLEIGQSYSLQAIPKPGNLFSNWLVNGVSHTEPNFRFVMASNLDVTASFVPDPFPERAGKYSGLFYDAVNPAHGNAGTFSIKVSQQGNFAGRIITPKRALPVMGRFDLALHARQTLTSPEGPLQWQLQLGASLEAGELTGSVERGGKSVALLGHRSGFDREHPWASRTALYTVLLSGAPVGHGFANLEFTPAGQGKLKGLLADGSPWFSLGPLSARGKLPVYVLFPNGSGSVFGWLSLDIGTGRTLEGRLVWTRTGRATNALQAIGSRYEWDARTAPPMLGFEQGILLRSMAGHASTNAVTWAGHHLNVASPNPEQLQLKLNPLTGLVQGSFVEPGSGRRIALRGAVLLEPGVAGGFLAGPEPGAFYLGPPEGGLLFPQVSGE